MNVQNARFLLIVCFLVFLTYRLFNDSEFESNIGIEDEIIKSIHGNFESKGMDSAGGSHLRRLLGSKRPRKKFDVAHEIELWKLQQDERERLDNQLLPLRPRDSKGKYTLGPKINDWDKQREAFKAKYPGRNVSRNGKSKILMLTGSQPKMCDNNIGDHMLLKSIKNKLDYTMPRGIDIFYNLASFDRELTGFWSKLPFVRKMMLSHPEVEWFWWMDSDAMFTDMSFELPMERYKDYNMVLHGWDELVYHQKNWIGINTGSFLFRNNQWFLDLLDELAPMGPKGFERDEAGKVLTAFLKGRPVFEADDQSALVWLLITQKDRWGPLTFLESSYYLHGYWAILVDKYEEMMEKYHPGLGDDRWPFVTHFVGCKPCAKLGDYDNDVERCLKNMERAFNFADNQILKPLGFQHIELGKAALGRLNITTPASVAAAKALKRRASTEQVKSA